MEVSYLPKFYEIFPYGLSRGKVRYNKKLFMFQTAAVLLTCGTASAITFVDEGVILRTNNMALYLIYLIRRLAFVFTILISYFPIIDKKFTAQRLLKILSKTTHFDSSVQNSKRWFRTDCAFLMVMVCAIVAQERGNRSSIRGHVKILSNFLMNLLLYFMLSYYRRILCHIADKLESIDLSSGPAEICRRHAVLHASAKTTVKMFSVPVLGLMTISGLYLCSNLMYMLGNIKKYAAQFTVSSCYLIYYSYLVSEVAVGSCIAVLKAANRVIDHMVETCFTSENPETVKLFKCHYNLYGNLELRPLGLVVLEKPFLTQYFGAIASYVAITLDYMDTLHN